MENDIETERSMVIVDWTNEEGSRFAPAMVGSGVWAGDLKLDWAYDRRDIIGKRLEDELVRIGYKGTAPCRKFPVHCYYEFHIEQGPVLDVQKKVIGSPKGTSVCTGLISTSPERPTRRGPPPWRDARTPLWPLPR